MCPYFCKCNFCSNDKTLCEEMGDGSPFCFGFICSVPEEECNKHSDCISFEELASAYSGGSV